MSKFDLSKYSRKCTCHSLEEAVDDPHSPIGFDEVQGMYFIQRTGGIDMRSVIHYCPWCGGDAPMTFHPSPFAVVPPEETKRLQNLTQNLHTRADVLAALGAPDEEIANGSGETVPALFWNAPDFPRSIGQPDRQVRFDAITFDVMRYRNLSSSATIEVIVRPDQRVNFCFQPKLLDTKVR
jgi:hypothetical protein